ncbi:MAG: protein-export membrane protein SecD [Candidatus Buchananbacteria bacterium RIFCSPHIGHO2_01_FULL_39_8]|uniref:Protein translocase subunit SecD n=1 Tax=Candidatus Buchananbacteria bacterium RIFCSPHIGHO2_01_FULL_39_8 TaxID=1797533 RepID=A0A1G1XX05_9BACT|nr:hypothetical protein [uncultured bacterium]OGY44116.1 MAG: protein-export membrane protein SecD [Candidatus Buchananbacteria bacterium RIFCSPHIGHO2_01_FULL_39_8]
MVGQRNKIRLALFIIFILAVLAVFLDFPATLEKTGIRVPGFLNLPFRLGLDLQGGTHLVYEADLSQIPSGDHDSSIEGVRDVIERRVNAFGVAEPVVQTTKTSESWRVIVELAGVHDVNQAITMIGETPLLEFKEQNPNPVVDLTEEQKQELETYNQEAENRAKEVLSKVLGPNSDFGSLAQEYSEDPGSKENGGDLGLAPRGLFIPEFEAGCFDQLKDGEISRELTKTSFGYHIIKREETTVEGENLQVRCSHILIRTKTEADVGAVPNEWVYTGLTGKQLKKAVVQFDPNTQIPQVSLEFNDEGSKLFADITEKNVGRPVAIFLDGLVISSPVVQEPISGGQAVISGNFTIKEAKTLAQRLNAGALPVPIKLISQQTVGATLGNESIQKSLKAGLIGLIAIGIFMILYYRLPGIVSVFALLFYALIMLALFKLIPVTLTLAGIAGFVLSFGMAVDANVLIFERLKEELKKGKTLETAISEGFKRAWPSILDGNLSTLITCFILMAFTTSVVKGFAITLSIGILISMFSAMTVTQMMLKLLINYKFLTSPRLFGVKLKKQDATNN